MLKKGLSSKVEWWCGREWKEGSTAKGEGDEGGYYGGGSVGSCFADDM